MILKLETGYKPKKKSSKKTKEELLEEIQRLKEDLGNERQRADEQHDLYCTTLKEYEEYQEKYQSDNEYVATVEQELQGLKDLIGGLQEASKRNNLMDSEHVKKELEKAIEALNEVVL